MRQAKRQKQQEKLEDLIRDLERDLSEGKSQVAALEETYKRLEESERLCQELASENRRLVAEIAAWQERGVRGEESERHADALRRQLEMLREEHALAVERNRDLEQRLGANTPPAAAPIGAAGMDIGAYAARATQFIQSSVRENRRVATGLAGVLVIALVAVLMLRGTKPERPDRAPTPFSESRASLQPATAAVAKPAAQPAPRVRGAFQTIRPTRVYSEPNEDSDHIADIGKGTRVNVVNSQNGWLEIHSKHGRPPGFIRRDAAERVTSN